MKEFNPPNTYRYEEIDYHGETAIRIRHNKYKDLDYVFKGTDIEEVRQAVELMEENFKRH